jgi:hypothetical protein
MMVHVPANVPIPPAWRVVAVFPPIVELSTATDVP